LANAHDQTRTNGWVARIEGLLAECDNCVEHGYAGYLQALQTLFFAGNIKGAADAFAAAVDTGTRFGDIELATIARTGRGRCLIYLGEFEKGLTLLDEAMVTVSAGEISPMATADTYCTAIEGCQEVFDLHRVQVWTSELSRWCAAQPELVAFRGQCMVDRCEVLLLGGDWQSALAEAQRACQQLSAPKPRPPLGAARYQEGELHRLRGELSAAEVAYRHASQAGRDPQPGLALLRLAQGDVEAASAAIRRALDEVDDSIARAGLLPAQVEISIAADDVETARAAATELARTATALRAPLLRAIVATADGRVLLAEGNPRAALSRLRTAESLWTELETPYELARTWLLLADACRAVGDTDGEALRRDAALATLERLGAASQLSRLTGSDEASILSRRELEVIRHVAAGESNREIAAALVISERTVERHISNIFAKLGVSSRAAAIAYAFTHDLA
jgi:ATP/maltotriose-dependent transcriptional regulator MalT